jgi:subtilisin family serine protease
VVSRFKLVSGLVALAICVSALAGAFRIAPATAQTSLALPSYAQLVENAQAQTWDQQPGSKKTGPVSVVVHMNMAPLGMIAKNWTHQQRRDYVKQIQAAQDALAPQITALGGTIVGRFAHAATGLAVRIDASKVKDIRTMTSVLGVTGVQNYKLDLTETVPWIGATDLQNMGITGRHTDLLGGQGIDVAVIDSGIDFTHKKLGGPGTEAAYAEAYCGNPGATPDPTDPACLAAAAAPADPALFGPNAPKVKGGYDWVGEKWPNGPTAPDPNPIDYEGHGTHVADIIGGLPTADGTGDQGVAPGVNIWGFKACSAVSSSCEGLALLLAVDDALDLDNSDYGACDPASDEDCTTFDPADVINMSLGSPYGQPEDDLTHFSNIASYYGSVVVVSAGNSGDRPYIVGSPSTGAGVISVAQSTVPSDKLFKITTTAGPSANGLVQPWGPSIAGTISGALQYGNGAGGNTLGCAAFPTGSLTGKVLLVDRGSCAVSLKGANGSAAGAVMVIVANNSFSNTPPSFSFGGGTVTVPTLTITQNEGAALKTALGSVASASESNFIALQDDIVASSARGPRIADGSIKPDISAPGASVSAEVGTGDGKTAFGGTSGAAPMVAGSAALIVEKLERMGILRDGNPGVVIPGLSVTSLVKAMLMNTANINTYIGGSTANGGLGFLAPITLQGAGRVDVLSAYNGGTVALDVTDLYNWLQNPDAPPCTVSTPPTNALTHVVLPEYYNGSYDCLSAYPFGNSFFNAWNAATGSLSFGYDGVSGTLSETRKVLLINSNDTERTYNLSTAFRYNDDKNKGVTIKANPEGSTATTITVPGKSVVPSGDIPARLLDVTITANAKSLRNWTLDAGQFGASGTNIFCNDPNPQTGCPTLTMFEHDGFVTINGGADNTVRMPWQILPKKAAKTYVDPTTITSSAVTLRNPAAFKPGDTDVFSLMEISPNNCEIVGPGGSCVEEDYVPGILPGINQTAIDIKETGVRSYSVPGLNAALGLPAAPSGAVNDEVLDFAATVYDLPFRASHNYPVEFDIYIDANRDGVDDYVVFNADRTLNAADGRNAVFVADINPADGTRPTRPYFYSFTDFNSQNWILPVPAAAIGVRSNQPFKFFVLAFDAYFTGSLWDCAPFACGTYFTYQSGLPKYRPVTTAFQVKTKGSYRLPYSRPSGGAAASPSQVGLLFMYRDAEVGRESDSVTLP